MAQREHAWDQGAAQAVLGGAIEARQTGALSGLPRVGALPWREFAAACWALKPRAPRGWRCVARTYHACCLSHVAAKREAMANFTRAREWQCHRNPGQPGATLETGDSGGSP